MPHNYGILRSALTGPSHSVTTHREEISLSFLQQISQFEFEEWRKRGGGGGGGERGGGS